MSIKATRRRMISCCAQIINDYVLGYKIPELVKHEKIKARKLSYDSQVYLLMLGQYRYSRPCIQQLWNSLQAINAGSSFCSTRKASNVAWSRWERPEGRTFEEHYCRWTNTTYRSQNKRALFDAPNYAIYQIQVSRELQLFSVRRIHPSRYLVEKGSYAEPLVLWDSTSSGKPSPTRKCTIFTGVWEDVRKVYGIAECRF